MTITKMTIIEDVKRKTESLKTGVINLVQRTRVGKRSKGENASENQELTEPEIPEERVADHVAVCRHDPTSFHPDLWELEQEEKELNLWKLHSSGQQTTASHLKQNVCHVSASAGRHSQTKQLNDNSVDVGKQTDTDPKPGTSYEKGRQKCLSDSSCLTSASEVRKGGKHLCKREIQRAKNVDITKRGADRCYDTDDEAADSEPLKRNVPEQLQGIGSERFYIPTGPTSLTNRRPKLEKVPPSAFPALHNHKKGLQSFQDEELARRLELRQKKLKASYQEICDHQNEKSEDFKNKYRHAQSRSGTLCQPSTADVWGRAGKRRGRSNQHPDVLECCTVDESSKLDRELSRINAFRGASPRSMCTMSPQVGSERDPLEGLDDLLADIESSWGEREQAESKPEALEDSFWNIIAPCSDVSQGTEVTRQRKAGRKGRTKQEELQRDVDMMDKLLDELGRPC